MTATTETPASTDTGYPRRLTLKGRRSVRVRPMTPADADTLHAFFLRIPAEDLLFLRRDVTDQAVIDRWAADVAEDQTLTLLAEREGRIVGEASVHRTRTPWTAHIGEIRVVVDAEHRALGLGSALVQAIFLEALARGLEKLVAEMTPDQKGAINVFQRLGFRMEGLFRCHVRDRHGDKHDLIVMAHETGDAGDQLARWGVAEAVSGSTGGESR
jgi:L-amino acid N-acyltransferase YncA